MHRARTFLTKITKEKISKAIDLFSKPNEVTFKTIKNLRLPQFSNMSFASKLRMFLDPSNFVTLDRNLLKITFLFSLFGGSFKPEKDSANVYWTHVRKCFINGNVESGRRALKPCSNAYLEDEIEALKPKLIVAVGKSSLDFLSKYDSRLKGKLNEVFIQQTEDIFNGVKIGSVSLDIALVPHPSGLNRFWNKPPAETLEILMTVRKRLLEIADVETMS